MTPDVNVLVAAARAGHVHHGVARQWLDDAVRKSSRAKPLILLPAVAVGFVRVVTDRRFYPSPATSTEEALANIAALLERPHVRWGEHGGEWAQVAALCARHGLAGPILSDAWIAATVLHLGEHLVTFDRGFRRLLPPRHLTVLAP
mgnify:CR=1 FL=1